MILGIFLIIGGVLIAIYPPLLSIIVALFMIFLGILLCSISYYYKKISREFRDPFINFFIRF